MAGGPLRPEDVLKSESGADALVKKLRAAAAKWTTLRAASMNALADILALKVWGCDMPECKGKAICSCCGRPLRYPAVDPKTRLAAAVGALSILSKIGDGKSLADRAEKEDLPLSPLDASKAILGKSAVEVGGTMLIPVIIPPKGDTN